MRGCVLISLELNAIDEIPGVVLYRFQNILRHAIVVCEDYAAVSVFFVLNIFRVFHVEITGWVEIHKTVRPKKQVAAGFDCHCAVKIAYAASCALTLSRLEIERAAILHDHLAAFVHLHHAASCYNQRAAVFHDERSVKVNCAPTGTGDRVYPYRSQCTAHHPQRAALLHLHSAPAPVTEGYIHHSRDLRRVFRLLCIDRETAAAWDRETNAILQLQVGHRVV